MTVHNLLWSVCLLAAIVARHVPDVQPFLRTALQHLAENVEEGVRLRGVVQRMNPFPDDELLLLDVPDEEEIRLTFSHYTSLIRMSPDILSLHPTKDLKNEHRGSFGDSIRFVSSKGTNLGHFGRKSGRTPCMYVLLHSKLWTRGNPDMLIRSSLSSCV